MLFFSIVLNLLIMTLVCLPARLGWCYEIIVGLIGLRPVLGVVEIFRTYRRPFGPRSRDLCPYRFAPCPGKPAVVLSAGLGSFGLRILMVARYRPPFLWNLATVLRFLLIVATKALTWAS